MNQALTPTYTNNTSAGTATANASFSGDTNHTSSSDSKTFTIAKAAATVTFTAGTLSQTYDGSVKTVATTTTPSGLTVDPSFTGTPKDAGSYPVTATINDTNYQGSASGTLVIGKATATMTFTAGTLSQTYDGSVKTVATTTTPSGLTVDPSFTGTPKDAGSYPVTATINDTNYQGSASGTLVILKAAATTSFTSTAPGSLAYNGSYTAAATTTGDGTLTIGASGACSISGGLVTITAGSGTCTVTATTADGTNYSGSSATPQTITAIKATPTVSTWPTASGITYGQALSASTLTGITAPATGTFAFTTPSMTPNAGTYSASVTFTADS